MSRNYSWRLNIRLALTCSFFIVLSTLLVPVSLPMFSEVHGASPAVSPGQWAHYSLLGNETGGTVDALFTVQAINGNNVTFTDRDTFQDGHISTDTIVVSILTGPTVPSSGQYFIVSPQKNVGDLVYPGDTRHYGQFPVQDITSRTYASSRRQSAHVQGMNSSQICIVGSPCPSTHEDFYWDDATGMFTEITKSLNGNVLLHVTMSSTNLWQPDSPIDPLFIPSAIVSLMGGAIVGVVVIGRYRRRTRLKR